MRRVVQIAILLALISGISAPCFSQANPDLRTFFKKYIGLSNSQIAAIRSGQAFAKNLHSRTPAEIFVFGAVYVHAKPEDYLTFSRDFDRLRKLSRYLAIDPISEPPKLSDFKDFKFDGEDIKALKNCKPGDCQIQLPMSTIEGFQRSVAGLLLMRKNKRIKSSKKPHR